MPAECSAEVCDVLDACHWLDHASGKVTIEVNLSGDGIDLAIRDTGHRLIAATDPHDAGCAETMRSGSMGSPQ